MFGHFCFCLVYPNVLPVKYWGSYIGFYEDVQLFVGCVPLSQPGGALANMRLLQALCVCVGSCPVVHEYCDLKKKKKTFTVTKSSYIHLIKTSKKLLILFYIYLFFMLLNCLISYIHSVQMWRKLVVCFGENIKVQNGANVYLTCVYCTDSS